jgi:NADH:ubiquinone oxidoreductase subunit D
MSVAEMSAPDRTTVLALRNVLPRCCSRTGYQSADVPALIGMMDVVFGEMDR